MRRFIHVSLLAAVVAVIVPFSAAAQNGTRAEINIPNIGGYLTLKCDFHMHTVFSDGNVWPTVRVEEAWRDGLDAISITDHIEYQPHKNDIPTQHDRPYDIAKPSADALGLILIRGTEITRDTPPGHHNAIFTSTNDSLDTPDFYDAIRQADKQGAFIFYNHPGWKHPQGIAEWFPYQEKIFGDGMLYGVEVVNGNSYYPLAHQWCIDKKLTIIGTTDVHQPITFNYDTAAGEHRPMTFVFAKKRTAESIREALFARRTAAWWKDFLIGDEKYLRPLFNESVEIVNPVVEITGNGSAVIQLYNNSDIDYRLTLGNAENLTVPGSVTLYAGRTVRLTVRKNVPAAPAGEKPKDVTGTKKIRIPVTVTNLYVAPETGMDDELAITVKFLAAAR